jgi:autotransporter-associated beta strand protein
LNLRNNFAGDTVLGNDVELAGSGLALLNPLGSAPIGAKVTMGNLRLGGGQELGLYLSANPSHNIVFPTVTLTGGSIRFSPKTPGFGLASSVGSDLTLGDISQTSASSVTMNGQRTLFITGTATYTGTTTVSNGTLHLSGALNGGGALTVAGGTLMGNGSTAGSVTVNPAGTIAPGASVGKFTASGAVTLLGTNVMEIDRDAGTNDVLQGASIAFGGTLVISNLTSALQAGDFFKLYTGPRSGSFSAIIPAEPGSGLLWDTNSLVSDGILQVVSAVVPQPYITGVVLSGTTLTISGTNAALTGTYTVLSSTNVALPLSNWQNIGGGSFSGGAFSFPATVDPAEPQRYYLLQVP